MTAVGPTAVDAWEKRYPSVPSRELEARVEDRDLVGDPGRMILCRAVEFNRIDW